MTNAEAKKFLAAKLECKKQYTSGHYEECNSECEECDLCYTQGNMGEQIEALRVAIKSLEPFINKPCVSEGACKQHTDTVLDKIRAEIERLHYHPKLDFIKNDEVVNMALEIIDKYRTEGEGENAN